MTPWMRDLVSAPHGTLLCTWLGSPGGSAQLLDADQVARGIAEGAVANAVWLLDRLLDDLGGAGLAPVGAGRHAGQFGEASAEGAQRRAADRETDLGDAEIAPAQQRHRALDLPRHQVAVRRFAVGEPELAAEVPGRHVRAAGERLDVQRLRVLPVDPVPDAAQPREVAQALRRGGSAGHLRDLTKVRRSCLAPLASHPTPCPLWPGLLGATRSAAACVPAVWP